jgi:hypothetical protein
MSTTAAAPQAPPDLAEARPLAREINDAFAGLVRGYVQGYQCSVQEAVARVGQTLNAIQLSRLLDKAPERLGWLELNGLTNQDPKAAARRWEEIKQAARDELHSGHRAARAFRDTSPFERAQFLALRDDLARQWRPQGGIEVQLVETMALAQTGWLFWMRALSNLAVVGSELSGRDAREEWGTVTPRLTEGEAMERAAAMAERFNRIFLRTLRALCELRKRAPNVVVQNAGQVNVGAQQVNVAQGPGDAAPSALR